MGKKKQLKVLHLASFNGNIGDIANHAGARSMFSKHLDFDFIYTELEIREFYWKQRSFNDEFVEYANSFDLLIIGGGNYFELWVENSATGTSIDITPERLAALTVPTIFYALGVDTGQGYSTAAATRFRDLIDTVLGHKNMFVCVRNDGSSKALNEVLGQRYAQAIPAMPDGGFFAGYQSHETAPPSFSGTLTIGINLAGDMLDRRFNEQLSYSNFLKEFAEFCSQTLERHDNVTIQLIPHIWRDIQTIGELLPVLPDRYVRRRISVAPLHTVPAGLNAFLHTYKSLSLVLGTRFHANVCAIGMGVPTRGLLNYPQVELLYEELDMSDRLTDVRHAGFSQALLRHAEADISNLSEINMRYNTCMQQLTVQAEGVLAEINTWLHAQ